MINKYLDDKEMQIILECMKATVDGPFFPEWEFEILFGVTRQYVAMLAKKWPSFEDNEIDIIVSIVSGLIGYPHQKDECFGVYISEPKASIEKILDKLVDIQKIISQISL